METLTRTQAEMLTFLVAFHDKHGHAPTFRQMADGLGLASTSGVHRAVQQLEKRGVLVRPAAKYRHAAAYTFKKVPHLPSADIYLRALVDQITQQGRIEAGDPLVLQIQKAIEVDAR